MNALGQVHNFNSTVFPTDSISSTTSRSSKRTPLISGTFTSTSDFVNTNSFFDSTSVSKSSRASTSSEASTFDSFDNGLSMTSATSSIDLSSSNNITSTQLPSSITSLSSDYSSTTESQTQTKSSLTLTSSDFLLQTSNSGSVFSSVSSFTSSSSFPYSTSILSTSLSDNSNVTTPLTSSIWHQPSSSETSSKQQSFSSSSPSSSSLASTWSSASSTSGDIEIFSSFTGFDITTTTITSSASSSPSSSSSSDTPTITTTSESLWTETQFVVATSVVTINVDSNGNTYATPTDYQSASSTSMQNSGDYTKSRADYVQVYQITDTSTTFECSVTTTKKPKQSTITTDSSYYNAHLKSLLSGQSSQSSSANPHGNSHKNLVNSLVGGIVGGIAGVFFILLMGYYAYKWLNRRSKAGASSKYLAGDERVNNNESGFQHGKGRKVNIYQEREMMDHHNNNNNNNNNNNTNASSPGLFTRQKETITNLAKAALGGTGKKNDKNANPFNEEFDFRNRNFVMPQAKNNGQKQEMQAPIIVETTAAAILRGSDNDNSFSSDELEDSASPNDFSGIHDLDLHYGSNNRFDPFADQHPYAHDVFSSDESFSDMSTDITSLSPDSRPPSQGMFTERL